MYNHKVLATLGCVMVLTATVTELCLGKVPVAKPHRIAVETFPLRIGSWVAGPRLAVDSSVQEKLATATIIEHIYTNNAGQSVDCMLVTATDSENLHDPAMCFPAQGWHLGNIGTTEIAGEQLNVMNASLDQQNMKVMYWLTGYYPPAPARNPIVKLLAKARAHLIPKREGMSLFVRLTAPDSPASQQGLNEFIQQIMPQIRALTQSAATQNPIPKSES